MDLVVQQPRNARMQREDNISQAKGASSISIPTTQKPVDRNAPNQEIPQVPFGLELLVPLDLLLVHQHIDYLESRTYEETPNVYDVFDKEGTQIFRVEENTQGCGRNVKGTLRPFTLIIFDAFGKVALILDRPCSCCLFITNFPFGCCLLGSIGGKMKVKLPDGSLLGEVVHVYNCCKPKYKIKDANGKVIMKIDGPKCADFIGCTDVADFPISTVNGDEIGCIRKTFAGHLQELHTNADNFGVEFPLDMSWRWKAMIFASTFLIDFMYFEESHKRRYMRF